MQNWQECSGGVTAAKGFKACGVHAGIKTRSLDMALLVSDPPAVVAGAFTTNRVQAAPVQLCRQRLAGRVATAVVVNSGSANACTGPQGVRDADEMSALTARALGVDPATVFVCSTGTIGKRLPMDRIANGVKLAAAALSADGGESAARAIMTTDTVVKQSAVALDIDGVTVRIGGMTKGSGMIAPNMATMLAFITTDAAISAAALQACLSAAVEQSFNRITVDGDCSTNDTVLLLANGAAGNATLTPAHPGWPAFCEGVGQVCRSLAMQIVKDGEGATRFVTVTVRGAQRREDAHTAARAVAQSLLCKTAWFGGDPNWGRVIAAIGYSGAAVDPERVDISFDHLGVVRAGTMAPDVTFADLEKVVAQKSFAIDVDLHLGDGEDTVYTCDCSDGYVKINASYMT